jgi:thiol-disulfide isomerase/thioredoxin
LVINKEDLEDGPLQWWKANESTFPTVGFLAR